MANCLSPISSMVAVRRVRFKPDQELCEYFMIPSRGEDEDVLQVNKQESSLTEIPLPPKPIVSKTNIQNSKIFKLENYS